MSYQVWGSLVTVTLVPMIDFVILGNEVCMPILYGALTTLSKIHI